jgi:benzylsuccinate CoA-transferase BbsF subunit
MEMQMTQQTILRGIRVLSLEQVHVLPWGTAFLADFGADVIRVEGPSHMNDRRSGPFPENEPGDAWWNEGGTFAYWARNKKSLCLDITQPRGKEVFFKLVAKSDIVTDNFRPGTTKRLGVDHDSLMAAKPDIITLSCTAYGHTGPWRAYGARARTVDAACGLSYLTGYEGGPAIRASSNYMDHTGGLNIAYALLLALYRRRKTGQGARLDLSMYETGVSCIAPATLEAQHGITRPRLGTAHLWKAPHHIYPCQGHDRWITISVSSDAEWEALKTAMGQPDWAADERFNTTVGRHRHRHDLDARLAHWTATQDCQDLMHALQKHGVKAGAVNTSADLMTDAHMQERRYFEIFDNPNAPRVGPRVFAGRPFRRASEVPIPLFLVSALGQHNLAVLRAVAGLTEADIQALYANDIVAASPRDRTKPAPGANSYQARDDGKPDDPQYKEKVQRLIDATVARR